MIAMKPMIYVVSCFCMASVIGLMACSAAGADESRIPLSPRRVSSQNAQDGHATPEAKRSAGDTSVVRSSRSRQPLRVVASSLAIVLGGLALLVAGIRRQASLGSPGLMETLTTVQVAPKVRLHLVRLGSRLLLLHLTPQSVERVAEITDPDEVRELLAAHYAGADEATSERVGDVLKGLHAGLASSLTTGGSRR